MALLVAYSRIYCGSALVQRCVGLAAFGRLASALAHTACLRGYSVLFAAAIDIVNRLSAAESNRQLARELKRYQSPQLLLIGKLEYLPLDKRGAELLFQVITKRYERDSKVSKRV